MIDMHKDIIMGMEELFPVYMYCYGDWTDCIILGCDAADTRYAKKLVDDIFFEYKMSLRPLNDTINALHVNFSVLLNQAIELVSCHRRLC